MSDGKRVVCSGYSRVRRVFEKVQKRTKKESCTGATGKGEEMERKFGIFNTVEELNRAAAAQKEEGDLETLIGLAEENGLEKEDAEDYMDDCADCLCTPYMAAIGKLNMEEKELRLESQLKDWKDFIIQITSEYEGDDLSNAIFSPEKHMVDVLAAGLKKASKNRVKVDEKIAKAAGLPGGNIYIGMCGRDELRKIVMEYYLGEKK